MDKILSIFKALSEHNRLKVIVALTKHAELCACQLSELLQVSGATTSRHLEILINANLIDKRKEGRWVYYRLKADDDNFGELMNWIKKELSKSEDIKKCLDSLKKITAFNPKEFCAKSNGAIK